MRRSVRWLPAALLALPLLLPGSGRSQPPHFAGVTDASSEPERRRRALLQVEDEWLHARDAATLERILADDFVHPVPQGYLLSKAEHIAWFVKHPPPAGREQRFERLQVRLYGRIGIVNGVVVTTQACGKPARTLFTDVFDDRDGRWQAVNAQENPIEPGPGGAGG